MKMLMLIAAATCAAVLSAFAAAKVPSEADVRSVGKYLTELTRGDVSQMRQKKITKEQYADALADYAADEKKPAAKFALFREAFKAYADAKCWEKADGVYGAAQAEGGTEYALHVVGRTMILGAAKELKARVDADRKSYTRIGQLKGMLKKTPGDESLCESLGLEYAAVGEWEKALAAFLTAPGEVAKVADWELNKGNAYTAAKAAAFWWDYADGKPKAKMEALRLHAAMWYELALGENSYSGNEMKIVQGRIEETKSYDGAAMQEKATLAKQVNELKPIVLPLKSKTAIEFVGVPAGEFMMGTEDFGKKYDVPSLVKRHKVTITRPFWLSKYKVTKEVWKACGNNVVLTDYDKAMGGLKVPQAIPHEQAMEFCNWLTKRFRNKIPNGYVVRLPTEAEWEYALFGKETDENGLYRNWKLNADKIRVDEATIRNIAMSNKLDVATKPWNWLMPCEVGRKAPNGFGLYDMLGAGFEIMLDTIDTESFVKQNPITAGENINQKGLIYLDEEIDPLRYFASKPSCILRGGWVWNWFDPQPFDKRAEPVQGNWIKTTLRLCIGPDLMKEKGYAFKPPKK